MESVISGLLSTFLLDLLIFLLLFVLFTFNRKIRSVPLDIRIPHIRIRKPYYDESSTSLKELLKKVYSTSNYEMIEKLSYMPYTFLELHKHIFLGFLIMTILGIGVLLPVYYSGDDSKENQDIEDEELEEMSIINIQKDDNMMVIPGVMICIFSAVCYIIVQRFYRNCRREEYDVRYI